MIGKGKREVWRDVLLIVGTAAVLFLPSFATRDLWNPDEPRYMEVAREMVVLGDYLVPHLNGDIYPDKPPLFFWLAAGLYRTGLGYNSGRVLAALASIGTVLLTYFLARRLMPVGEARLPAGWAPSRDPALAAAPGCEPAASGAAGRGPLWAALTVLTVFLFSATSKAGVIDPLLTFLTTASIFCGIHALAPQSRRFRAYWLGCYSLAALCVLTKGPVGVILPAIVLTSYGFAVRRTVRVGGWIHLAGVLVLLCTVGAWLVPALVNGGKAYANEIVFKQNLGRVVRSYSHRNPSYYYLAASPVIFLPWSLLFGLALGSACLAWQNSREPAAVVGLTWFLAVFAFFTLMSGKRPGYLMPLMPAFGLIMGRYLVAAARGEHPWARLHKALVSITLGVFGLAGAVIGIAGVSAGRLTSAFHLSEIPFRNEVIASFRPAIPWLAIGGVLLLLATIIVWRAVIFLGRRVLLVPAIVMLMLYVSLLLDLLVVPRVNQFKSGKEFVALSKDHLAQADRVFLYGQKYSGVYNLYTGRTSMPVLSQPEELRAAFLAPGKTAVIGWDETLLDALGSPPTQGHVVASKRLGHRNVLLVTNWGPAG